MYRRHPSEAARWEGKFSVIPSEAARRAAQSRDLFLSTHQTSRSLHFALRAPVGMTGGKATQQQKRSLHFASLRSG